MAEYQNRGYLDRDFRLFHLRDQVPLDEVSYHTHDFHKLLLFVAGTASYVIEGKHYALQPWDVALVERGSVHRPEVGTRVPYERYVLYLSPAFVTEHSTPDCNLGKCFLTAREGFRHVLRPSEARGRRIAGLFQAIGEAESRGEYGGATLAGLLVQELLIELARAGEETAPVQAVYDDKTVDILRYLNDHLTEPVSIDSLAARFFVSKYHMMRRFREETGYSVHSYLANKRLLYARELLQAGTGAMEACFACGYGDYSAFARAFKKQFGMPPSGAAQEPRSPSTQI